MGFLSNKFHFIFFCAQPRSETFSANGKIHWKFPSIFRKRALKHFNVASGVLFWVILGDVSTSFTRLRSQQRQRSLETSENQSQLFGLELSVAFCADDEF
jgi:hypothetical protein